MMSVLELELCILDVKRNLPCIILHVDMCLVSLESHMQISS